MLPLPGTVAPPLFFRGSSPPSDDRGSTHHSTRRDVTSLFSHDNTVAAYRFEYLQRMLHLNQIDWEFAVMQMLYLCVAPQKVYDFAEYRRQTKDTAVRDDPGFVLLLSLVMLLITISYAIALRLPWSFSLLLSVFFPTFVYLVTGVVLTLSSYFVFHCFRVAQHYRYQGVSRLHVPSASCWWVQRRHIGGVRDMTASPPTKISGYLNALCCFPPLYDWFYCFDVHSNSIFPSFLFCSVIQYFFLPLLLQTSWPVFAAFFSNSLYASAWAVYCYISLLGYSHAGYASASLLCPVAPVIILAVALTLFRVNMTRVCLSFFVSLFNNA